MEPLFMFRELTKSSYQMPKTNAVLQYPIKNFPAKPTFAKKP